MKKKTKRILMYGIGVILFVIILFFTIRYLNIQCFGCNFLHPTLVGTIPVSNYDGYKIRVNVNGASAGAGDQNGFSLIYNLPSEPSQQFIQITPEQCSEIGGDYRTDNLGGIGEVQGCVGLSPSKVIRIDADITCTGGVGIGGATSTERLTANRVKWVGYPNQGNIAISIEAGFMYSVTCNGYIDLIFKELDQRVNVYRFENNSCSQITLFPAERLPNDYTTEEMCSANIIQPILLYRLADGRCNQVTILPADKTSLDFQTSEECQKELKLNTTIIEIYRLEGTGELAKCIKYLVSLLEVKDGDYTDKEKCEADLPIPPKKPNYLGLIIIILTIIGFSGLLIWLYLKVKRKR